MFLCFPSFVGFFLFHTNQIVIFMFGHYFLLSEDANSWCLLTICRHLIYTLAFIFSHSILYFLTVSKFGVSILVTKSTPSSLALIGSQVRTRPTSLVTKWKSLEPSACFTVSPPFSWCHSVTVGQLYLNISNLKYECSNSGLVIGIHAV